jgi:acetylornithine deacetylase/succinyl-diaminopimelate desuccinylase-like protein
VIQLQVERDEVRRILADLLRLDTTNPPGNEVVAAVYLRDRLRREGIEGEILESAPGRASYVARLSGDGTRAPLLLMSHLDVVPAERSAWTVDPFGAEEKDGFLYGRGALDIKNLVAMEAMVMILLQRRNVRLARDVIFLAEADEEAGGRYGISWLVSERWEKIRAEYAINEGGIVSNDGRKTIVSCQCAEKGAGWYRVRFSGRGGHASAPHASNPIYRLAGAVSTIRGHKFPAVRTEVAEAYFRAMIRAGKLPADLSVEDLFRLDRGAASPSARNVLDDPWMDAMLRNTVTPTMVEAGQKNNVIPPHADLVLDTRRLPGVTRDEMIEQVWSLVGRAGAELSIIEDGDANASRAGTELWKVIESALEEKAPGSILTPYMSTGGTDSGALRERGVICYGFEPTPADEGEIDRIHGNDERVRIEGLWWGTEILYDVVERMSAT